MSIFDIIKNAINTVVDPLLFGDATVYRKARVPNGRGGFTYVATQHACRALVIEYTDFQRSVDGIPASNRQLLLAADSLAVEFKTDDVIGFPDGSFWKPVVDVIEPTKSLLTIQVATAPAPMVGAVGTGIFNVGNFTFSGTGVAANVGIGEWNVGEFTFYGEGEASEAEPLEGTGDFTFSFTFEAAAVATLLGSADLTIDEFTFLGEGRQDAGAVGDWTYDFTFLGSGYGSNIAIADITIDEFTFAATGVETSTAAAAFTIDEFSFTGTGVGTSTAAASLTIEEFIFTGTGVGTLIATATITIPEFTFAGAGSQAAPIAHRATASVDFADGNTDGTVTILKPTGVVAGDVLIACVVSVADVTITPPSGWTQIERFRTSDDGIQLALLWKAAGGAEPSDYTFTESAVNYSFGAISAYSGVDNTTPIQSYTTNTALSGTTMTAFGVTTTEANTMILAIFSTYGTSTTTPSGMTMRMNCSDAMRGYDQLIAAAGATGNKTSTSTDAKWAAAMIALNPA